MSASTYSEPDKKLAAVCGLFCPGCTVFIASMEDKERLRRLSERMGQPASEMECHGCRSDTLGIFCRNHCKMAPCAARKKIDFCGECDEYPCDELREFQRRMPHRIELWDSQERIREKGYEVWYLEMVGRYSCKRCGTVNSAYDLACRECGHTPSCDYVEAHLEDVSKSAGRMGR